jgi:hypothetical protein
LFCGDNYVLETPLGSAWIALPEEGWKNWWRGVRKEEATKRCRQILAEAEFIWDTCGGTREDIAALAKSGIFLLRFVRRLEAPFFAPQRGESEEEFSKAQRGRATSPEFLRPHLYRATARYGARSRRRTAAAHGSISLALANHKRAGHPALLWCPPSRCPREERVA